MPRRRRDLLVSRGMSETLLDDLGATVAALEATLETSRAARRDHVGASADLKAVGGEILHQVRVLDGLVRYRFGNNAELMAAWKSARNMGGPAGPRTRAVRGEGGESPAEGGAGPAAPGREPLRLLRLSP